MRLTLALAVAILPVVTAVALADDPPANLPREPTMAEHAGALRADALQAYAAGAFEIYHKGVVELDRFLPNHPDVLFRLAAAQARTGREAEALETLEAVAAMGVSMDVAGDPRNEEDFRSLAGKPGWEAFLRKNAANGAPITRSQLWHTFSDVNLLPEDVVHDPKDGALLVSSVLQHKVVRVDARRNESEFPLEAPERGWNVQGLALDPARGVLWVSAQAIRGYPGIPDDVAGTGQLSAYGLKSKRRLYTRAFPPRKGKQAAIADLAVAPNSDLLVADSVQARLYRVTADRKTVDLLERPFIAPQDIAFARDGRHAFVADYARGIARIDLESGVQQWLAADRSIALAGIDGLYAHGDTLVAVQNGTRPARIAAFALDKDRARVTRCDILERNAELLGEPTHGVIVGDEFVYLANTGWDQRDEHGALKKDVTATPATLRRLKLPAGGNLRASPLTTK